MFDSQSRLRHLAFFDVLATSDEGDPAWREAAAGLVVLRYVETWLDSAPRPDDEADWSLRSVMTAVDEIDDGSPVRTLLGRVIEAVRAERPSIRIVAAPLLAFGQALEYQARWDLAADVYQTLLARLHPMEDSDSSIAAHLRLAQCQRTLGRLDEAMATYQATGSIASAVGDMIGVLRARIGEGNISMLRGNLPHAERVFDAAIADATGPMMQDVRVRALHERANLAHYRQQYELAIKFAYDALGQTHNRLERDRILGDIAVSFLDLGVYSAARDAYLILSATAQEQFTRWAATLNLLEIAAQTGVEPLFELYRRQLATNDLPPYMNTAFHLGVGEGYRRFGHFESAERHIRRALQLAGEHGYNKYLFEAEDALRQLHTSTPPQRVPAAVPLDVEEVACAIREMRVTAGVAG